MSASVTVLRLGHRKRRDKRVTTHCALAARALGADEIVLCGENDEQVVSSVEKVSKKWGGKFRIRYEKSWRAFLKKFRGKKVHLTFYGMPVSEKIQEIRRHKKICVVIGAGKVPREVYGLCDYNIAVTNQPHSEVSALAVFLHEFFSGKELRKRFRGAENEIIPRENGKKVVFRGKKI